MIPAGARLGGKRHYASEVVRRLAIVETAQRAGLTLDEIRLLLEAEPEDEASTERLRQVAERKLPDIDALIERAQLVREWLEDAARCHCPTLDDCPLFDEPARLPERAAAGRPPPSSRR